MVNTEEFTIRLNRIMEYYDLSAASFADKIDVGRSSISHLLSGRNKPSLDFVMKIVQAFPEVELYWLLNGKGNFPKKNATAPPAPEVKPNVPQQELFPKQTQEILAGVSGEKNKKIQRIVIFYSDGSFDAYEN